MCNNFGELRWIFHRISIYTLCGILFNHFMISADITPRGVPLSRAALYDPQKDFVCLDGSKMISFAFVNDDYCDCPDGSDEPGTSACPNARFFCVNAGHISMYIPTTRVNDSVCDCCDGTDEDTSINCPNTCDELGRSAREQAEREILLAREGYAKRLEMSQQGKSNRETKEQERVALEAELKQVEAIKDEKQKLKDIAEAPEKAALEEYKRIEDEQKRLQEEEDKAKDIQEAEEIFQLLDSNNDEKITVDEIKAREMFDKDKDGAVSDEEASFFLNLEPELSKEDWLKDGWLLAKPFILMRKGLFIPPSQDESNSTPAPDEQQQHEQDIEDDEAEDLDGPESQQPIEEMDEQVEQENLPEPEETPKPKYDQQTMELIQVADKARQEYNDADKNVRDVSYKLQELNDALNIDFADDERFAPLHGQCFDFEDREYVYTFCPFKDANQRGKNGGGHVNLGRWGSWTGEGSNKYTEMLYDKGQSCWNGPQRSATVFLNCGIENQLTAVTEPSRCEYRFEFSSPASCQNPETIQQTHDEL